MIEGFQAFSEDGGSTWTDPTPMRGCRGVRHDPKGVWQVSQCLWPWLVWWW